jgi:hypothetical protein
VFSVTYEETIWTPFGRHDLFHETLDSGGTPGREARTAGAAPHERAVGQQFKRHLLWA